LKGEQPWIAILNATLTRALVQVRPATRTQTATVRPAERLQRQRQQDILAQQLRHVQAIVLHDINIHLGAAEFTLLVAKGFPGFRVQHCERIR
jgi:hypothetical protein